MLQNQQSQLTQVHSQLLQPRLQLLQLIPQQHQHSSPQPRLSQQLPLNHPLYNQAGSQSVFLKTMSLN